jgi:PAS domain S-box-containing protein
MITSRAGTIEKKAIETVTKSTPTQRSQDGNPGSTEERLAANQENRPSLTELETNDQEIELRNQELQSAIQELKSKVDEALRESDKRYQTLFNSIDEGFCVLEMIFDADDRPVDYRFLETNPAFEKQTGLVDAVGQRVRMLVPDLEDHWVEIYGRVAVTGRPERFVDHSEVMGRWFDVYAFPLGESPDRKVALLFTDITQRRKAEEALRQLNETLENRVAERTQQVRNLVSQLTMSEHAERRRISQILHDDLQQRLYGIQFQLTFLSDLIGVEERASALKHITAMEEELKHSLQITRSLSVDLSPPVLYDEGLTEAIRWLANQMKQQHGLTVQIHAADNVPLPGQDLRVLLFQVVRELLFNVVKHAGVSEATVSLSSVDHHIHHHIHIEVVDQGGGFDADAVLTDSVHSHGLLQSRHRLELMGGHIEITSRAGFGTRIIIECPVSSEEEAD